MRGLRINQMNKYDLVVGLEVHVQLSTRSKLFVADKNSYGDEPNTNISPITLAHPGTLPILNKTAVEYAVKLGLACNCEISQHNTFDRKNYFYPDLPKGYQITQDSNPICLKGEVKITTTEGPKSIMLHHMHLEEDAGKSMHTEGSNSSLIDYNRSGTPLIEIVTEPDMSSAEEAAAVLSEIRKLVRFLDIGDGNMEQGSLRCDANISLKPKGAKKLGERVEIKNMNSIRNIQRAIQYEVKRQSALLDEGKKILQETRGFNDETGETIGQRTKEGANDYRYHPDPDLVKVVISDTWLNEIRSSLPKLPNQLNEEFVRGYNLGIETATMLSNEKETSDFFIEMTKICNHPKAIANWIIGPIKKYLNKSGTNISSLPVSYDQIGELIDLTVSEKVSFSMASNRIFPKLLEDSTQTAEKIALQLNLIQNSNTDFIEEIADDVISTFSDKVDAYRNGKKGLLGMFVGEIMKKSKGKANPKLVNEILLKKLNTNR